MRVHTASHTDPNGHPHHMRVWASVCVCVCVRVCVCSCAKKSPARGERVVERALLSFPRNQRLWPPGGRPQARGKSTGASQGRLERCGCWGAECGCVQGMRGPAAGVKKRRGGWGRREESRVGARPLLAVSRFSFGPLRTGRAPTPTHTPARARARVWAIAPGCRTLWSTTSHGRRGAARPALARRLLRAPATRVRRLQRGRSVRGSGFFHAHAPARVHRPEEVADLGTNVCERGAVW